MPLRSQTILLAALLALVAYSRKPAAAQTATAVAVSDGRPIARIKDNVICCPREPVVLDGWASIDIGGEITQWLWDFTDDGKPDTVSNSGEMILPAPRNSKIYPVVLWVKDNEGNLSEPDTAIVHVMDVAPTVRLRADTTVKVGVRVNFNPRITWVCAQPVSFEWDFDDDGRAEFKSGTDGNTSKVYYTPGTFYATFKVTDAYGRQAGLRTAVHVTGRMLSKAGPESADSLNAEPSLQ